MINKISAKKPNQIKNQKNEKDKEIKKNEDEVSNPCCL